jgi:hypothetical protein
MKVPLISMRPGTPQCDGWIFGSNPDRDNSYNNHKAIGDVKLFPACRPMQHLVRPVFPVEYELLNNMRAVCNYAQP